MSETKAQNAEINKEFNEYAREFARQLANSGNCEKPASSHPGQVEEIKYGFDY